MRQSARFAFVVGVLGVGLAARSALAQGSLEPPGAPAATMKTLSQIEPRTPIAQPAGNTFPIVISAPGSYYLTSDIIGVTTKDGIDINVDRVTLDLNGFGIVGPNDASAGDGIEIASSAQNVTVYNGTIRAWGGNGVNAGSSNRLRFQDLRVFENKSSNIYAGAAVVLFHCELSGSTQGNGLLAGDSALIVGCTANGNQIDGIQVGAGATVKDTIANSNATGHGIRVSDHSTVIGCTANENALSALAGSSAGSGVSTGHASTVFGCTAADNKGDGVEVLEGSTVSTCTVRNNQYKGIELTDNGQISRCTVVTAGADGIQVGSNNSVVENTCSSSVDGSGLGIHMTGSNNRIDGNQVTQFQTGYSIDAGGGTPPTKNLVIRNSAMGNTSSYTIYTINGNQGVTDSDLSDGAPPWANIAL